MNVKNGLLTLAAISTFGLVVDQNQIQVHADGVPRVTGGQAGLPRMDVVDVSSNNGYLSTNDFQIMKNNGVRGIIVKLTEGTYYRNPYASSQVNNARAVGLKVSAYHYSTFNNQNNARSEANFFADYASQLGFNSSDLMVNDLEDSSTTGGDVSGNSWAFNDQLKNRGFTNGALYTYTSYKNNNGLNTWFLANDHIWMAAYPYYPSINSLWNSQYGMWQWSSNAGFGGISGTFDVSIDYSGIASQLLNGYVYDGSQGHDGYRWYDNGQLGTGFRYWAGSWYWFDNGERSDNSWHNANGYTFYTGSNGATVEGLQTIGNSQYYFGNDDSYFLRTNQNVTINGSAYKADANGVLTLIKNGYLYDGSAGHGGYRFYDNDVLANGFRYWAGSWYWFDNGERSDNSWHNANGYTYYTGSNGVAVEGLQTIGNSQYYFGNDGSYFLRTNQNVTINGSSYKADANGVLTLIKNGYLYDGSAGHDGYRFYDNNVLANGFRYWAGGWYWFDNGERSDNSWHNANGYTYYTGSNGVAVEGLQTIGNSQYYFGNDGSYFLRTNQNVTINGSSYKADANGVLTLIKNGYLYDGSAGHDGYRFYDNNVLANGFRYWAGGWYWFDNGERSDNSWHNANGYTYYTGSNGVAVEGLQTIGNSQYYFGNDGSYFLRTNQNVTINGLIYKTSADGLLKPWYGYIWDASSQNNGYRFYVDGQLANGFRYWAGGWYWFDDGVRSDNAWHSAYGYRYYTGPNGVAVQGYQTIAGQRYYFGNDGSYFLR